MNEPEKKPERVEPTIKDEIKPVPAAANDDAKKEPVVGVTPVVDGNNRGKIEPVITNVTPLPERKDGKVEPVVGETIVPPVAANTDKPASETPAAETKPAAETSAATGPAEQKPVTAATEAATPKKKGWRSAVFNFVASAGISAAASLTAKTVAGAALASAGVSTVGIIVASGFVVGAAVTVARDAWDSHKEGLSLKEYFSKAHWKGFITSKKTWGTFALSTGGALLGSAVALGFQTGFIQDTWNNFWNPPVAQPVIPVVPVIPEVVQPVIPPVEVQPVIPPVEVTQVEPPVVAPVCLTPGEQFTQLIDGRDVSSRVTDAMTRAASTNPAIAAQGTKDLAFFAFNGFDGVPKNPDVAVQLFKQAAESGNMQAKVDLVYMQYHGLGGIPADKAAAVSTMKSLAGGRAAEFVSAWGGAGKSVAASAFSTETIFKGIAAPAC